MDRKSNNPSADEFEENHLGEFGGVTWLAPEDVLLRRDSHGRLVLTVAGREYDNVSAGKVFALTEPDLYVSLRDSEGDEIGILVDPSAVPDVTTRDLLRAYLRRRYFIPIIQKVESIREFWIDQVWTVQTDRGPRQFTLQGRSSVRFISSGGMMLIDTDDNRYLIEERDSMDPESRAWVDRFIW